MGCCKKNNAVVTYYGIAGVKLADLKDAYFNSYPTGQYCGVEDINFSVDQVNPLYRYFQHAINNSISILGAPFSTTVYLRTPVAISAVTNKQGVTFMVGGSYNYTYNPNPERVGIYGTEVTCQSNPCINDVGVGAYYFDLRVNEASASGYPIKSYKESAAGISSNIYAFGCEPTSPGSTYLINWTGVVKSDGTRIKNGDNIEVVVYPDPQNNRSYPVFIELLNTRDKYSIPFNQGLGNNADQINYPYGLCGNYIQFLEGSWQETVVDSFTWPEVLTDTDYTLANNTLVGFKQCFLDSDVVVTIPESTVLPKKVKVTVTLNPCENPGIYGNDEPPFYKTSIYNAAKSYVESLSKTLEIDLVPSAQNGYGSNSSIFGTYSFKYENKDYKMNTYLVVEAYANSSVDNGTFPEIKLGYLDSSCLKSPLSKRGNNYFYFVYINNMSIFPSPSCFANGMFTLTGPACGYPRYNYGFKHVQQGECSFFMNNNFGNPSIVDPILYWECLTDGLMVVPIITKEQWPNGQIVEVVHNVSVFYKISVTTEEIFE